MDLGLTLGICTTFAEKAAHAVAYHILEEIQFDSVIAGDIVSKKKPDLEIYLLALEETGFSPDECSVVADSRNGLLAAQEAHMNVVVITNGYTENEDLSLADIIVSCLGDPQVEKGHLIKGGEGIDYDGVLRLNQLLPYFSN